MALEDVLDWPSWELGAVLEGEGAGAVDDDGEGWDCV